MVVVPSAAKMMKEFFGKVPCEEELAMAYSELAGGAEGTNIIPCSPWGRDPSLCCRKTARCVSLKSPPWTSTRPAFLTLWLLASLWSGRRGLCQGSAHLSQAVGVDVLTRDLGR